MCRFVSFSICFDNVEQMEKRYKCVPVRRGKCVQMSLDGKYSFIFAYFRFRLTEHEPYMSCSHSK